MTAPTPPDPPAGANQETFSKLLFGRRAMLKPLLRWGGIALALAASAYFFVHVAENASELASMDWHGPGIAAVAAALGLYAVLLVVFPVAWFLLLRGVGETPRFLDVFVVSMLSQFAKYIPGNIAQHIGRVALARACGLDASRVVVTMIVEVGWVVFTGAAIAVIMILVGAPAVLESMPASTGVWQLALAGAACALAPLVGVRFLNRLKFGPLRRFLGRDSIDLPTARVSLCCLAIYTGNYLVMGAIVYLLAHRLFGMVDADFFLLTGIFAVAWIAGFIVPGAPGGLGVREAVLVAALGPLFGEAAAVAIAVLLRVIAMFGDGLGFLFGLLLRYRSRKAAPEAALARLDARED